MARPGLERRVSRLPLEHAANRAQRATRSSFDMNFTIMTGMGATSTVCCVLPQTYYPVKTHNERENVYAKTSRFSPGKIGLIVMFPEAWGARRGWGFYYIAIFPVENSTMEKS